MGYVSANRLSYNLSNQVVLLEAGGEDHNLWIQTSVGYFKTKHNLKFYWCYRTQPDEGIHHRQF